jgi:hypothetical protein
VQIFGDEVVRPNPVQWLRYTFAGSVPARNHAWVLYDATVRTWVLRHIARYLVLVTPLVVPVMIFLPAPLWLRLLSTLAALLPMMMFYLGYTTDSIERRVEKAGYPGRLATQMREQRALDSQRAVAARSRERHAARLQRRGV